MLYSSLRPLIKNMLPVFLVIALPVQEAVYPNYLSLNGSRENQTSSAAASQAETDALSEIIYERDTNRN